MDLLRKLAEALGLREPQKKPGRHAVGRDPNRAVNRKRMRLLDGFIVTDGMLQPRACTVRDVSPLGACVEIWDDSVKPALLRNRLTLFIPSDGKEVDCDIMWKRNNAIGLKFASPFRDPSRKYA